MKYFILITSVCFLFACSTNKFVLGDDLKIQLDKAACFGSCPVYSMSIDQAGYVLFDGTRFTNKIGRHALHLSPLELDTLAKAFDKANLGQYENDYNSDIPDLPLITLTYVNNGFAKTIKGKSERPQPVLDLQVMLENIAHRDGWTSLDTAKVEEPVEEIVEEEEEEEPKEIIIDSEIVITFLEGTIISRWMSKWRVYDMYVQRPMTEDRKTWIVQFNRNKISPNELLAKVQGDESVASAEFNKKIIEPEVK